MGKREDAQREFEEAIQGLESLQGASDGVAFHQLFLTFMAGGFTENQALKLLAFMITAGNTEIPEE